MKPKKSQSKHFFCMSKLTFKEDNEDIIVNGLIATTHPDRVGDILSVNVLNQMATLINDENSTSMGMGAVRSVSLYHDWVKEENPALDEVAFIKPNSRVIDLEDGHKGLEVDAVVNKYYRGDLSLDEIKFRIDKGGIGGFSIEYDTDESKCKPVDYGGTTYNFIEELSDFGGVGFARSRMIANPHAVIYKEIESQINKSKEVNNKMSEEEINKPAEKEQGKEAVQDQLEKENKKEDLKKSVKIEKKVESVTPEHKELRLSVKECEKIILNSKEYKEAIENVKLKSNVLNTGTNDENPMKIRIKEINENLNKGSLFKVKELITSENLQDYAIKEALIKPYLTLKNMDSRITSFEGSQRGNLKIKCVGKGLMITGALKLKGTLDSSSNTSSYTQAPVEFDDVFAPGIIDTFNNQINYFGFLRKEAHPGGTHYQWRMITDKNPDSNPTFVEFDDTSVAKNFASKSKYQTPIKVARRGVSVADTTLRYSSRSLGEEFQLELEIQMTKLMTDVDVALFAEVADGTGNDPLGLEAVADSAGNTTLYGLTRSTANRLSPASATDTYNAVGGNLTEKALREGIQKLEIAGSRKEDIAIIAHPITRDYLFNLLDGERRFISTEASFGFNQKTIPSFDGYPIIVDFNCNNDAIYIIDTMKDVIVVAMEPRVVNLARVGAATAAYLEFHFAHVYKEPRKIHMLDTLSGP